jgi:hypothetical protein
LSALPLSGQETSALPQAGFLNVVNLVTLKEPTYIDLGGFKLNGGEALVAGESSGVLAIIPETYAFTLSNSGAKPESISGSVMIENGKTFAIVCYDEVKEFKDGSKESKLRYNLLVEADEIGGPKLSLISLLDDSIVGVEVCDEAVTLSDRIAYQRKLNLKDELKISIKGRLLTQLEVSKPIHYIGFLFKDPETGEVALSLIQNEKLEYHPPLETEEEE